MRFLNSWFSTLGCAFGLLWAVSASNAEAKVQIQDITPTIFFEGTYFQRALEHPKVAKQRSRSRQLAMVARDIRRPKGELSRSVDTLEALGGDPLELAKKAVMAGFKGTRVDGEVLDIILNADEPRHVVMYVKWRGSRSTAAVKEASTIAAVVAKEAPLVSTLSLAAIHPKAPKDSKTSVWSAKIARGSMGRIQESRIESYADRMYQRLFEGVKALPF